MTLIVSPDDDKLGKHRQCTAAKQDRPGIHNTVISLLTICYNNYLKNSRVTSLLFVMPAISLICFQFVLSFEVHSCRRRRRHKVVFSLAADPALVPIFLIELWAASI